MLFVLPPSSHHPGPPVPTGNSISPPSIFLSLLNRPAKPAFLLWSWHSGGTFKVSNPYLLIWKNVPQCQRQPFKVVRMTSVRIDEALRWWINYFLFFFFWICTVKGFPMLVFCFLLVFHKAGPDAGCRGFSLECSCCCSSFINGNEIQSLPAGMNEAAASIQCKARLKHFSGASREAPKITKRSLIITIFFDKHGKNAIISTQLECMCLLFIGNLNCFCLLSKQQL